MTKETAFVTGANGFIGSHLVKYLLHRGYRVRVLVRRSSDLGLLRGQEIDYFYGDLFSNEVIRECIEGASHLYHVAGVINAGNQKEYYEVNARGTENLVRLASRYRKNIKRFLHVSSISVMGPSKPGEMLSEGSPLAPLSHYGKSKIEGEDAVINSPLNWTILRPTNILGIGQYELYRFMRTMNMGLKPLLGKKSKQTTICFVEDLVRGMVLAAENACSLRKIYIIASKNAYGLREIIETIGANIGKRFYLPLPYFLVYAIAVVSKIVAILFSKNSFLDPQKIRQTKTCLWIHDSSLIERDLGFKTEITLDEGIGEIVRFYKSHDWRREEPFPCL